MNNFKEWLSDYLRYFMLALAALLVFALTMIGIRIYQNVKNPQSEDVIVIETETEESTEIVTETESETESKTESESESETETESDSESETETESEPLSKAETESESTAEKKTVPAAEKETEKKVQPVTEKATEKKTVPVTEKQTESETETETETEYVYVPVYKTLQGSCYLRSGPSMEAEIIGEYMYGTTVEFLEDVGGWYKVQIDGMVGYMGARFF